MAEAVEVRGRERIVSQPSDTPAMARPPVSRPRWSSNRSRLGLGGRRPPRPRRQHDIRLAFALEETRGCRQVKDDERAGPDPPPCCPSGVLER
jgi:hypothetical protein